jgi:hypothetical protein
LTSVSMTGTRHVVTFLGASSWSFGISQSCSGAFVASLVLLVLSFCIFDMLCKRFPLSLCTGLAFGLFIKRDNTYFEEYITNIMVVVRVDAT